jgi:hypothetical protein
MQGDPAPNDDQVATFMKELHAIAEPIGDGGRDYYPYELRSDVMAAVKQLGPHPLDVYQALLARERDPLYLETLVFLIGRTDDPRVDDILLRALDQPVLRPRALYALGAMGTRNWPHRDRDRGKVLDAIARYIGDTTPYTDIHYRDQTFETGDFARAAFIRIAGLDNFPERKGLAGLPDDPEGQTVGTSLPTFTTADRAKLDAAIQRYRSAAH